MGVNENGVGEVFRLNLEVGRYMRGYEIDVGGDDLTSLGGGALQGGIATGSVNAAAIAEGSHNLLAFGTSLGTVEFWDSRSRSRVGTLPPLPQNDMIDGRQEVTALQFDRAGLNIATGSSTGLIHLYDLRSPKPTLKKDQGYGYPIQDLVFLTSSTSTRAQTDEPKIMSADRRIIKIWDARDGTPWTSVEPAVDINSVTWCKDSGMLLTANEGRQQHSFFIPQLGPAPKWCSFLDNLVEEMAEDPNDPNAFTSHRAGDVYDNYKFLTMPQLQALNLSHLVGTTSLLRPYMHGYFVAQRLYEEAKVIADPFIWEEQRSKRVRERIDAERESRIRGNKKVVAKVNRRLAEKIMDRAEKNERRRAQRVLANGGDEMVTEEASTTPETPMPRKVYLPILDLQDYSKMRTLRLTRPPESSSLSIRARSHISNAKTPPREGSQPWSKKLWMKCPSRIPTPQPMKSSECLPRPGTRIMVEYHPRRTKGLAIVQNSLRCTLPLPKPQEWRETGLSARVQSGTRPPRVLLLPLEVNERFRLHLSGEANLRRGRSQRDGVMKGGEAHQLMSSGGCDLLPAVVVVV